MIKGIAILMIVIVIAMNGAMACENVHSQVHKHFDKHQFRHHEECNKPPEVCPAPIVPKEPPVIIINNKVTQTVTVPVKETIVIKEKSVGTQIVEQPVANVVKDPATVVVKEPVSQPENNSVAKNETIPMKKTGTPLELPLIAGLLVVAGSMYAKIRMG